MLQWFTHYEPMWLFILLSSELIVGLITLYWVVKEYIYDERKDIEKKQKRTKTTKKTTKGVSGEETIEETTEVSEPMAEYNVARNNERDKREGKD